MATENEHEPKCGIVTAVCRNSTHAFSKATQDSIRLLTGLGVEGDAHEGVTVKHRSRVARDPNQPNLRQIHLIHAELLDELRTAGFAVSVGQVGENITTRGICSARAADRHTARSGRHGGDRGDWPTQPLCSTGPFSARLDGGCVGP